MADRYMTIALVLVSLLAVFGWWAAYLWWRDFKSLDAINRALLEGGIKSAELGMRDIQVAHDIILQHALSGKVNTDTRA